MNDLEWRNGDILKCSGVVNECEGQTVRQTDGPTEPLLAIARSSERPVIKIEPQYFLYVMQTVKYSSGLKM